MARKTARALSTPGGARPPAPVQPRLPLRKAEPRMEPGAWRALADDLDQAAEVRAHHDRFYRYLKSLADYYREQGRRMEAHEPALPRPSFAKLLHEFSAASEKIIQPEDVESQPPENPEIRKQWDARRAERHAQAERIDATVTKKSGAP